MQECGIFFPEGAEAQKKSAGSFFLRPGVYNLCSSKTLAPVIRGEGVLSSVLLPA